MLRIYADFNCQDEQGRMSLNTVGSLHDPGAAAQFVNGMRVILYVPDELEVEGVLVFEDVWLAVPDWSTLRYCDEDSRLGE